MRTVHALNDWRQSAILFFSKGLRAFVSAILFFPALTLISTVADAQMTDASGRQLDEILVYAQKKDHAESLQEVPAAITAFNEDQLDAIVFQRLDDLSYNIPNVQLEQVGTFPGVQNFSIRGQGINSSIPSVDPTVGTFVDGVYIGTTYGVVVDTWDLESVEVLRGPQGLLFGRNVTGGAVLLRTARPDPSGELGIKARVMGTNEDRNTISFAIEGPLVQDKLAGKLMLYYEDDDGYFETTNPIPGAFPSPPWTYFNQNTSNRNMGQMETKIARPSFVWAPSDELDLTLIVEYGETKGDGAAWTVIDGNPALPVPFPIEGQREGLLAEFSTTVDEYGETDLEWKQATFEINWDIFGGTLTNIAGWREVEIYAVSDIDGTYLPAFTAAGDTNQDQWSNELRWSGQITDIWDVTVGIFYLDQDIFYQESRYIGIDLDTLMPSPDWRLIAVGGDMNATTLGIFWNNDIHFTENWVLNAGIRYNDEEKKATIIDGPLAGPDAWCADVVDFDCSYEDLEGDWDNWIPKLGLQWNFGEFSQAYGFWTKGYRTGGFNFRNTKPGVPPLGFSAGPTEQEEQNSYEMGLKTEVFDNRLRMNFAVFYNEIEDMQRELNQPDPDVVVLQATINAGDVEIKGAEFEFQAVATDALRFWGSVGYLDGKYTSKNPLYDGINPFTGLPYLGDDLPRLAPWSYSLGGGWDIPLASSGMLNLRADYAYRDSNAYDDANANYFDKQRRLSASVNWYSPEDHWTVSLFGKNLRDEANWGNITSIAGLYNAGPMQRGKEYGLQLQYRL